MEKKKTRFFLIIGVLVVISIFTWMFMARGLKEGYRVLSNDSPEVRAQVDIIKDYRKLKGYKVIKDAGEYKLIMVSAGLTYGREDKLEVQNVEFVNNEVEITVKETIDPAPAKEVVNYPFVIVKVDTNKDRFKVVNTDGEEYQDINLDNTPNINTNNEQIEDKTNNEDKNTIQNNEDKNINNNQENQENPNTQDKEENKEENKEEKPKQDVKNVTVEFQGRVDDDSIEVKMGDSYTTFSLSEDVKNKINNYNSGDTLNLSYIEVNGQNKVVGIN